jgi:hypothetical protein
MFAWRPDTESTSSHAVDFIKKQIIKIKIQTCGLIVKGYPFSHAICYCRNHLCFQKPNSQQCQEILYATPLGQPVDSDHLPFLMGLFQFHTEWTQKSANGIAHVIVQKTAHGTPCFYLVGHDGAMIDICFGHAIESLPSGSNRRQPQVLKDFKNAARQAIQEQIFAFLDQTLMQQSMCLTYGRCAFQGKLRGGPRASMDL